MVDPIPCRFDDIGCGTCAVCVLGTTREDFKRFRMEMQQHIAKITEQKATAFRRVAELEKEREKLIDDCCRFENANVALVDERKRLTDALAYCFDRRGINFSYDEWAELCVKALGRQPAALGAGNDGPGTLRAEKAEAEVARLRVELAESEATVADLNRQIDEAHRDNARLILESAGLRDDAGAVNDALGTIDLCVAPALIAEHLRHIAELKARVISLHERCLRLDGGAGFDGACVECVGVDEVPAHLRSFRCWKHNPLPGGSDA